MERFPSKNIPLQPAQSTVAPEEKMRRADTAWKERQPLPSCLRALRVAEPPAEQAANRRCYAAGQA